VITSIVQPRGCETGVAGKGEQAGRWGDAIPSIFLCQVAPASPPRRVEKGSPKRCTPPDVPGPVLYVLTPPDVSPKTPWVGL